MLNLKKKLFTIALSLFCAGQLMAVPALPGKMVAKQADGTMITIQKLGDEHYHMTVTEDGYPLKYNFATNNYEYAELTEQGLVSSNIVAMPVGQRDARAKAYLQKLDKEVMMQIAEKQFSAAKASALQSVAAKKSNANGPKRVRISDVPTTGKQKVLNILVEFSNCKFSMSDPKAYYDRFFHEKGFNENGCYGSVHDYYYEGSGHNYDPDIDCYGPIQVSGTYQSYAGSEGTENAYKMVQEACKLLYQQGVDLSPYDTDGDGVVDNVYVIYAGYGQADSNKPNTIWPHSWNLSNIGADIQLGNVKIDRYATSQEINGQSNKPVGIGTFVHEFGHVLGLADHYNTMNAAASNTPGAWDVMCAGSYNGDQNCPATFTAFERYSLDWLKLTELNATTDTFVTVTPLEDKNAAFRVSIPNKNYEYFIIENRQPGNWFLTNNPGGVMESHIAYNRNQWQFNTLNNEKKKKRCHCVTADQSEINYSVNSSQLYGNNVNNITRFPLYSGVNLDDSEIYRVLLHEDGTATFNFRQRTIDGEYKPTTGQYYSLVRSVDELATGDSVIVVNGNNTLSVGTTFRDGLGKVAAVNVAQDGLVIANGDVQAFTVRKNKTSWALKVGNSYLAISRDGLTTTSSLTNGRFDLAINNGEASISFTANYANHLLSIDDQNYLTSVVSSNPSALRIYKLNTAAGIDGTTVAPEQQSAEKVVYNLQGQRVNSNGKLPKGIYIINGKKTVVR